MGAMIAAGGGSAADMSEDDGVAEARRSWAEAAAAVERKDMSAAHDAYRRAVELLNEHGTRQERVRCHREWVEALRTPTVAGALLRALCGQLIESGQARQLERAIVRATSARRAGYLCEPPTRESLRVYSPAKLRALGLHARRGATLVRLCEALDLE